MSHERFRLVLDTNTVVRAFSNWDRPSGVIVEACSNRELSLLLSRPVLQEYRRVLKFGRNVLRLPTVDSDVMDDVLEKLKYHADIPLTKGIRFRYDRDPSDEKFIVLAIAGSATHIITRDRDLLSLGTEHSEPGVRFRHRLPAAKIVRPEQFLAEWKKI